MIYKCLVSADHHLKRYTQFNAETQDGCGSRLNELLACERWLLDYCCNNDIPEHIILGDWLDEKEKVDGVVASELANLVNEYINNDVQIVALVGNHESAAGGRRNTLEFLRYMQVNVIEVPDRLDWEDAFQFQLLPHHEDPETLSNWVAELPVLDAERGPRLLLGHLAIQGAKTSTEYKVKSEFDLKALKPENWDYILLGHIHHPQQLLSNMGYIGPMAQRSFGDEGCNSRAILLTYDTKTKQLTVEPVRIPGPVFKTFYLEEFNTLKILGELENDPLVTSIYARMFFRDEKLVPEIREEMLKVTKLVGATFIPIRETLSDDVAQVNMESAQWDYIISKYVQSKSVPPAQEHTLIETGLGLIRRC